jgi:hypothetical protein
MAEKVVLYAYFYSTRQAQLAVRALETLYDCSEPKMVAPVNGRPVLVIVSEPDGSELLATHYSTTLVNQAIQVIMNYDGQAVDKF